MFIVITTYHFLLASGGEYVGTRIITNFTLHYLLPIFVFMNWIVFERKKKYSFKHILYWMAFPLLYCVVSLLRGLIDGFYPYFFLNPSGEIPVGVGSYANVALFVIAYLCVYVILGFLLILLNRIISSLQNYKCHNFFIMNNRKNLIGGDTTEKNYICRIFIFRCFFKSDVQVSKHLKIFFNKK